MTDLWEHYGHIKLVTPPEVKWQGRRCWFQDTRLLIGRAEGDLLAYNSETQVFENFVPRHSGPMKMRPGRNMPTRWRRFLRWLLP